MCCLMGCGICTDPFVSACTLVTGLHSFLMSGWGKPFSNNPDTLIDLVLELTLNSIDVLSMEQSQDQDNV